ncbi:MAG: NTP transferase domain-containing protein [Bacteroidetes bacterium]|nr:NTP transferase domain-containing protein [Bacteroidota bacterium]
MQSIGIVGVVLCGGESRRMGIDKGDINYHGMAQREYVLNMLRPLTSLAVYSCGNQAEDLEIAFPDLPDLAGHGPLSGLLSVHRAFPDKDLLLVGCDYPLLQVHHLETILNQETDKQAICYQSGSPARPEPLITLYRVPILKRIDQQFNETGEDSLRRYLKDADTLYLEMDNPLSFISADRPEDVSRVRQLLQEGFATFDA